MNRYVRRVLQIALLSALLQGCVLPLAANISNPVIGDTYRVVYDQGGQPVTIMRVTFHVEGTINNEAFASVIGYKCGGDPFLDSIGVSILQIKNNTAFLEFRQKREIESQIHKYDLKNKPFDVCIHISIPAFPSRRESNTIRIDADQVSQAINRLRN